MKFIMKCLFILEFIYIVNSARLANASDINEINLWICVGEGILKEELTQQKACY